MYILYSFKIIQIQDDTRSVYKISRFHAVYCECYFYLHTGNKKIFWLFENGQALDWQLMSEWLRVAYYLILIFAFVTTRGVVTRKYNDFFVQQTIPSVSVPNKKNPELRTDIKYKGKISHCSL